EFKKPGVSARDAFTGNLTHYKAAIPQLFWSNAFLIASNGTDSRIGSLSADWERFFEWKRIESENEPRRVSLEVLLRGTCQPKRFLDYVENFTLFTDSKGSLVKIIAQNHQFIGVNNAIAATLEARRRGHGRAGVFWQTQGSCKSYSMAFYSQKIQRKLPGDWTFMIVTDRAKVKQSARELVQRIKDLLVLNWQQKFDARAKLEVVIEEALDIGLPRAYTPELYQQKCEAVFAHIEQAYPERDQSVYAPAG
ncbi:MAG: type I restriction enzyme endonuclease domain-containing protein, partial [Cyanobium sp.]